MPNPPTPEQRPAELVSDARDPSMTGQGMSEIRACADPDICPCGDPGCPEPKPCRKVPKIHHGFTATVAEFLASGGYSVLNPRTRSDAGPNDLPEGFPFEPDYALVSKSDLAAVLTVYEAHVPPEVRANCSWYVNCKAAVAE